MSLDLPLNRCRKCGSSDIRLYWITVDGHPSISSAECEACDHGIEGLGRYSSDEQVITAITKAWNERNPMYDFTLIRKTLKEIAEYRRLVKEAYRIPHNTPEHQAAKDRLKCYCREDLRAWATALHMMYAERRGKVHCPVEHLQRQTWDSQGLLLKASVLITERPVATPVDAVPSV